MRGILTSPALTPRSGRYARGAGIIACLLLAGLAGYRLQDGFTRLLWGTGWEGAGDLLKRHTEVQLWVAGQPLYGQMGSAVYPPTSYAILAAALAWLPFEGARWLWAASLVPLLFWIVWVTVRGSGSNDRLEMVFWALITLAIDATGRTIRQGNLGIHLIPPLIAGLLILHRNRATWGADLAATALLVPTLVKPNFSVPFFWIAFFVTGRARPTLLILTSYAILTLAAASMQHAGMVSLFQGWLAHQDPIRFDPEQGNIHAWLSGANLNEYVTLGSIVVLAATGVWVYVNRRSDPWLLVGVCALVARLWAHHWSYDDVLLLLPLVALFRVAKTSPSGSAFAIVAQILFAAILATSLAPARFSGPASLVLLLNTVKTTTWLAALVFLIARVWLGRGALGSAATT